MSSENIKVGLVGANANGEGWGAAAHIPAIKAVENVKLAALCTSSPTSAKASSKVYNIEQVYHNIDDLVKQPNIDLISCVVNIPSHYSVVKSALLAGKSVYCEWPLGATLAETEELAALAKTQKLKTAIGLQGRFSPELNHVRHLVETGWFGEIVSIKMSMQGKASAVRKSRLTWEKEVYKKATLFNIGGGHNLDYLQYCFGDISEVFARISTQIKQFTLADTNELVQNTVPDHILINGTIAELMPFTLEITSVPNHAEGWRLEVFGTKGTLRATTAIMPQISPIKIETSVGSEPFTVANVPHEFQLDGPGKNVALMYKEFAKSKDNSHHSRVPDFDNALKIHQLLDTIEESNNQGKKIKI